MKITFTNTINHKASIKNIEAMTSAIANNKANRPNKIKCIALTFGLTSCRCSKKA